VNADKLGLDISTRNSQTVADLGMAVLRAARAQIEISHPLLDISGVDLVELGSVLPQKRHYRNGVVFGEGQLDRSPCGTGTSAKLAAFLERGYMELGEEGVFSSITGSEFIGEAVEQVIVAQYEGFVPHITGRAYTTGVSEFVLDEDDIYPQGFLL
jgi:proline racemase